MTNPNLATHHIECRSPASTPFVVGQPKDRCREGWVNQGRECYIENFGEADYQHFTEAQFGLPLPPDTAATRRTLKWTLTKLKTAFMINGLITGRRSTHMAGVGATGKITILGLEDLPDQDFFQPGATFPCRLRHSNAAFIDDCGIVPRGASLKFTDQASGGPLDLIFNSGLYGEIFMDARNFWDFTMARLKVTPTKWSSQKEFMRLYPACYIGQIEATREPPESFANLTYGSKIVLAFRGSDGKRWFFKTRILRPDLEKEDGLPSLDVQRAPWLMLRHPDDDRPRDYLRQEFLSRVATKGIEYRLQFQMREWNEEGDSHELFSLARHWDEDAHPWVDIARIELDTALAEEDTESTLTNIINTPPLMAVPDAHHVCDPRSLAWLRAHVYRGSHITRRLRWNFWMGPEGYPPKDELIDRGPGGKADPALLGQPSE